MESNLVIRKKHFWGQAKFEDISFSFPDTNKILKANKFLLALCSPVFEAMFYGESAEKRNPIHIIDTDYTTFKCFLSYIYLEELHVDSLQEVQNLVYVAHKYAIQSMENACELYLIRNLEISKFDDDDFDDILSLADMFCLHELKEFCELYKHHKPNKDLPATWITYKKGDPIPSSMTFVEIDPATNWPLGVGRFKYNSFLIPGKFDIKEKCVFISYAKKSFKCDDDFEILCNGDLDWVESEHGKMVDNAVIGGNQLYREPLLIGKMTIEGETHIGKVHRSHFRAYFSNEDKNEKSVTEKYFVLMDKNFAESEYAYPYDESNKYHSYV
uniref:CSON002581 protein n=1 Tax=Culicoides sonorensis TaxID=179676 RepID=A0A336MKW8_CULSO